jgi:hypothetical protein
MILGVNSDNGKTQQNPKRVFGEAEAVEGRA